MGVNIPKVDAFDMIGTVNTGTPSIIHFEYTLGNSSYDVLQVDQGNGFEDIVQCNSQDCQADPGGAWGPAVPDPGGPMPVGRILRLDRRDVYHRWQWPTHRGLGRRFLR